MIHIRAMTKQDVPAVSRLLDESWRRTYSPILGAETTTRLSDDKHAPERLAAELADDNKMSFVAERPDGSIAGYAMAKMDATGDVMLDRLHIDRSEFGTGLAADLLHAVLAAHAGIPSIALEVIEGNDRAIAFYGKHGFEVVERRSAAHGVGGHASLIMRRLLPRA
ncbi:GNAT family N-acetyltransferase [Mesorhizobium sanjuanii]|uniref:GNAT family N-acetyltransferase n=1 Tax=Mesorhizobium sanjuanii TaxID=2037900 RepID=A0A2A6F6Y8_9HYPH|nr:GNAT family N-acetyltransferase [Mesorhizobium sanjuanii]PDQ17594.1 GNAT family N-acetyltransferase [Mesorhizobium sanjuanii]